MSWSDRRTLLAGLASAALLTGCGFSPAYAPGASGDRLRGQIQAEEPNQTREFYFVERFEDRLGRNDSAPFQLNYQISTSAKGLAITPNQSTYRYHLNGRLTYEVVDRASGATLTRGSVQNFVGYSAIGTTVATRASRNDAEKRLMVQLADQLVTQLVAGGARWLP